MDDLNNIDDLFRSSLKEGSSESYRASAWLGAEQKLNAHFRMIFLKKVLMYALPAVLALGGGIWYVSSDDSTMPSTEIGSVQSTTEESISSSEEQSDLKPAFEESTLATEMVNEGADAQAEERIAKALSHEPTVKPSIKRAATKSSKSTPPAETIASEYSDVVSIEPMANSQQAAPVLREEDTGTEEFLLMPTFSVGSLGGLSADSLADESFVWPKEKVMNQVRRIEVGIHGGASLVNGLENVGSEQSSIGLGGFAGVAAKYHINTRLFIRSGVTAHVRNNLSSNVMAPSTPTELIGTDADRLTYLDIPIQFGYNVAARHSFAFGMAFSPLVGYQRIDVEQSISPDSDGETRKRVSGLQREGFANFDVAPIFTYKFQATSRIDLMAELRYGLFDVTDNAYFGTEVVDDRNHQLRFGLSYSLTRR